MTDPDHDEATAPEPAVVRTLSARGRARAVALVGSRSFLGMNLMGLFEESPRISRIVSVGSKVPSTAGQKTRHYHLDLTAASSEESLAETLTAENVDTVLHLGFLSAPSHAVAWAHELESVGTMHVRNACRRARVRKVVMWSQTLLYGAHATNPNFLSESHRLRARRFDHYVADKMDAEAQALHYGRPGRGRLMTILRTAPMLGPTVDNYLTRYLGQRLVPAVMGFDPLWQFLHEADAVAAFKLAVDRDAPGVFNIVGDGVLPLSTAIKLAGRTRLPLPRTACAALLGTLWAAHASSVAPTLLDYLQYLCIADGERARTQLGFSPVHTSREALIDYASAQHLRDVSLLSETAA
jgi:UDP-glucose 4-epimerase